MTAEAGTLRPGALWAPLDAERDGGLAGSDAFLRCWDGERYVAWSWAAWRDAALRFAAGLRALGVRRGDRVACLLTNAPVTCAGVLGVWAAGATLVSLPTPARGTSGEEYAALLRRIVAHAEPVMVIGQAALADALDAAELGVPIATFERAGEGRAPLAPDPPADDDPAFVQYSSGSTSDPRGCVLTTRAIAWQLEALTRALAFDPTTDVGVDWLPLSHDMGLFGCLMTTYWSGVPLVLGTPQRFLGQPATWLEDCARFGATASAAPAFALELAARVAAVRPPPPLALSRLVVGGERLEGSVLTHVTDHLGDRLPPTALVPAYGLAEAVLAVTVTEPGAGPTVTALDAAALAGGVVLDAPGDDPGAARLAAAGRPLPGVRVEVDAPPGAIGELVVDAPSLAAGYLGAPRETAARFTGRGLRTGDLGFLRDGLVHVVGRLDDLLCVAGRNVYARDLELAIAEVDGVRAGNCAVVDLGAGPGERLVAVAELRHGHRDPGLVARDIARAARAVAGVRVAECVFLPRGRLPKTPSGKLRRFRCRELAAEAQDVLRVRP